MAQIAFTGNIVAQPEIKFAASGKAVTKARLAESHRGKNPQTQEWEDQGTSWRNLVAFGAQAEKLAELGKGTAVVVIGRETARAYSKDGEERQWIEVAVDAFGIVPKGQQQSRPSPQGEGFGGQQGYPAPQQQGGWPSAQSSYGNDPVPF